MAGTGSFDTSTRCVRFALTALVLVVSAAALRAQQEEPAEPYVLHVYTNLMQIPALVLDAEGHLERHVDTSRFAVSLDTGPKFRPAYVRPEGDDPLSLFLLLDLSGDIGYLLPSVMEALPALAPESLHPTDHISLYALDCKLVRSADDLPAGRATLAAALREAVTYPGLHGTKKSFGACANSVPLLNSLAILSRSLSTLPGRRAILVLSNGADGKSRLKWSQVQQFASRNGIAIFGFTHSLAGTAPSSASLPLRFDPSRQGDDIDAAENPFSMLCDLTGGVALPINPDGSVAKALSRFVEMLRNRYILEFHRPNNVRAGQHIVTVTLDRSSAAIRTGGTTVHTATAAELAKPEIVPSKEEDDSRPPSSEPQR